MSSLRRNSRKLAIAAIAGVSVVMTGSSAAAESRTTTLQARTVTEAGVYPAQTDGRSHVLFGDASGGLRVMAEEGSRLAPVSIDPACLPGAMGAWSVVVQCPSDKRSLLFVLATRTLRPIPNTPSADLLGLPGRYWVSGSTSDPSTGQPRQLYLNVDTGERRLAPYAPTVRHDLDDPALPLVRSALRNGVLHPSTGILGFSVERLRVRVGRRTVELRARCRCERVKYSAGVVSWSEGRTVRAYRTSDRRSFVWRPSAADEPRTAVEKTVGLPVVAHTSRHIVWSTPRRRENGVPRGRSVIFRAALPATR